MNNLLTCMTFLETVIEGYIKYLCAFIALGLQCTIFLKQALNSTCPSIILVTSCENEMIQNE